MARWYDASSVLPAVWNPGCTVNALTAVETAELYWACLEAQRNVGLPWDVFKRIPRELKCICPLERRITWRSPEPGLRLMTTMRVYSAECAQEMLRAIEFDAVAALASGYKSAKANFIKAVVNYQQYILALNQYGY